MIETTLRQFLESGGYPVQDTSLVVRGVKLFGENAAKYLKAVTGESASGLYIVSDGDNIFYVGKSKDVFTRLLQHLGRHWRGAGIPSPLGRFVLDNAPVSADWTIATLTVDDVAAMTGVQFSEHSCRTDQAEQALIAYLRPALNDALTISGCQAIPKSYKNRWDDNGEGALRATRAILGEKVE